VDRATLQGLVGHRLPLGRYRIDREAHGRTVAAVHAGDYSFEVAHPVFAHLAPHCGMGFELDEFFALVEFPMDGGAMIGEGDLTYHQPILIDVDYVVRAEIVAAERKHGTRTGAFDLVTLHLELIDQQEQLVVTSKETYVFPRAGAAS
jgi:hypothetical protein